MKRTMYCLWIAITCLSACKNSDPSGVPDSCITRLYLQPSKSQLSANDLSKATQLLQQNNITANTLRFYRYIYDACLACVTPGPYEYVRADQFFNGQLLFNGDIVLAFRQGLYNSTVGNRFNGIALDTIAATKLPVLRKLFVNQLSNDGWVSTFKDSCMAAQFGYYDLNGGSSTLAPGNFTKAWKIAPKNHTYPLAYFCDDQQNTLIWYFNGVETLTGH